LFPQITPSTAPSAAPRTGHAADQGQDTVARSSVIPISLTSPQFEAQILGLIVLLFGVAVVVTGISVRKVRAAGKATT